MNEERSRFIARVFMGVAFSVLLHVIFSIVTYKLSAYFEHEPKQRTSAVMDWIEPSDLKKEAWSDLKNQIVRKAEIPADLKDLSVKPVRRFLSEDKQTVKKEMRAAASGMTENRSDTDLSPSRPQARPAEQSPQEKESRSAKATDAKTSKQIAQERTEEVLPNSIFKEGMGDVLAELKPQKKSIAKTLAGGLSETQTKKSVSRDLVLPTDPRRNRGISTSGEVLPADVQIGDFTALNTDRFIYYTYYARIEEQIRHRWVRYVKAAIFGGGDIPDGAREFTTNLEIVLDREGTFVRAILHDGSGSKDIDAAPTLAFREARKIPHPPREMVKEDGTIRLHYAFHVDQLPPMAKSKPLPPQDGRRSGEADQPE